MIATTFDGTCAAIETAVPLAEGRGARLVVLVPKIVPYAIDIAGARDTGDMAAQRYRTLIARLGGTGSVHVCLCRSVDDVITQLTGDGGVIVVGGPTGRWRRSPEERFAVRLARMGRHVVYASSGDAHTRRRSAWPTAAMLVALMTIAFTPVARAQAAAPPLQFGAFLDAATLQTPNDPENHLFRNRGTTPRVDELVANMYGAYVRRAASDASRFGFEATVQGGEDSKLFGFSATAPNIGGADVLLHFGPTSVSYRAAGEHGATVQGGIFSSLIGYDSLYAKDNANYTRPWGADYTPYLMLGVNAAFPLSDRLTATAAVVNGYWHLAHANDVPSFGGQLAYLAGGVSLKQTVLYGPHQEDTALEFWRVLSDTIAERKAGRITLAGELQISSEAVVDADRAWWFAVQAPVRLAIGGPWTAAFRPEWCRDTDGRWTAFEQDVWAVTGTVEYRIARGPAAARIRGEYRYDRSTGPGGGFYKGANGPSGAPSLVPGQQLFIGAVLLAADGTKGR